MLPLSRFWTHISNESMFNIDKPTGGITGGNANEAGAEIAAGMRSNYKRVSQEFKS